MVLGGAYRIESQLDEGGMGTVYHATHIRLKRPVAVKVMAAHLADNEGALARFTREAEIISQLSHPHIVQVLDFDTTPAGKPYLVMEMLNGRPLDAVLEKRGALELGAALRVTIQAASALAAAHDAGIVHRDLKPANIFLVDSRDQLYVKLLDFGISKRAGENVQSRKLTGEFDILGTPDYMAPEQAVGKTAHVDHRGDQYALAVILYEMLTGAVPFHADDTMALLQRVIRDTPAAPSSLNAEIPDTVDAAILRALSKAPDERWPSVVDFSELLEVAAAENRLSSSPNLGRITGPASSSVGQRDSRPEFTQEANSGVIQPGNGEATDARSDPTRSADPRARTAHFGRDATEGPSSDADAHARRPSAGDGANSPGEDNAPNAAATERDESRRTSWHSKDPVKAVRELVDRTRQEMGLDNLDLAVSCAESALEIVQTVNNPEARATVDKNRTLFERVFERRLGRLSSNIVLKSDGAASNGRLSPEQAYLLSRLEGGVSLEEALDLSHLPRAYTLGLLVGLMRLGHISMAP